MFTDRSDLLVDNPARLSYGVAVTDVDADGAFEFLVSGFGFPNRALKWTGSHYHDIASPALADPQRQSIGVAAGDLDADGQEEIYVLNTDTFAGPKRFPDRLFDHGDAWVDLFELPQNQNQLNQIAGRSVICVDRLGAGQYGFVVASYGGPLRFYELDDDGRLQDVAPQVGVALTTGGRGLIAGPLVSAGIDIFAGNESGPNFLFRSRGDGTYEEVAATLGIDDPFENARGIALLDTTGDGRFDLVYGNWEGPHRLFVQSTDGTWDDIAPPAMARPSRVRTVIAADFDNDGYEELFFNHIGQPNRLFAWRDGEWRPVSAGDALEPDGLGTGAAVADLDGDGRLELLISHGESHPQPLALYHGPANDHHWLRVLPLTQYGAPARGAVVTLVGTERTQRRVIDCGSGYLCQMEPVAHFGLGRADRVVRVSVRFPDQTEVTLEAPPVDRLIHVPHPRS